MTAYLYLGLRKGLDEWMAREGINPYEHGRSVKWGNNGPAHIKLEDAPIEIVQDDDWYERTIWDELAVQRANHVNAVHEAQQRHAASRPKT